MSCGNPKKHQYRVLLGNDGLGDIEKDAFEICVKGTYRLSCLPYILLKMGRDEKDALKEILLGGPEFYRKVMGDVMTEEEIEYGLLRMAENRLNLGYLLFGGRDG